MVTIRYYPKGEDLPNDFFTHRFGQAATAAYHPAKKCYDVCIGRDLSREDMIYLWQHGKVEVMDVRPEERRP